MLSFFYASPSRGEEAYLDIKVTIPNRIQEPIKDISGSVSIITPDKIEEEDPIVPTEVLRDTPGLDTKEAGTLGEQMFIRLRGTESFHTLVMIDGIKVNSPFRGNFDLGDLQMDDVGQIEIIRGSQSALYGSEAIGGAIDIKTKSGRTGRETSLKSEIGNNETFREGLQMRGKAKNRYYSFSMARVDTEGGLKRDSFEGTTFAGEIGYSPTIDSDLRFTARYNKSMKELGTDFLTWVTPLQVIQDENNLVERDLILSSVSFSANPFRWWQVFIKGSIFDSGLVNENPADPDAAIPHATLEDTDNTRLSGEIQTNLLISDYDVITMGLLFEREKVDAEVKELFGDFLIEGDIDSERNNRAYYLQNIFKIRDLFTLQEGVRIDHNSDFGSIINPKMATSYLIKQTETRIRGSASRGFRAPSILELDFPFFGNPDLDPERSTSYEAGLDQWFFSKTISLSATYFYILIEDLIQISPTGVDNIGEASSKGVELEASIRPFNSLKLSGNYTYLKTEDRVTGEELPFRPRNKWNLSLLYLPTPAITLNIDLNVVSNQKIDVDFIDLNGNLLSGSSPGYTRVDLAASYDLFKKIGFVKDLQFFFKVNNLFDAEIMEVPGFPAAGINLFVGIKAYL
ncbi:MAG: TonB-dependent receptor [Nitrospirota bacterium]